MVHDKIFEFNHGQRSDNTNKQYLQALKKFEYYLENILGINSIKDLYVLPRMWKDITFGFVETFKIYLMERGNAFQTINSYLSAIKMHAKWAYQAGHLPAEEYNQIKEIDQLTVTKEERTRAFHKMPKLSPEEKKKRAVLDETINLIGLKKQDSYVLSTTEKQKLIATCDPTTITGKRELAIVYCFLDLGLRVGELCSLDISQVDFYKNEVTFYREKVSKTQTHYMSKRLREALIDFISHCPVKFNQGLFISFSNRSKGNSLSTRWVRGLIQHKGKEIDLPVNLGPHDLRHTWATETADKQIPLPNLVQAGGWTGPGTALRYIEDRKIANEGIVDN
jgi:integrase